MRNDDDYTCVFAWENKGENNWEVHREELNYENIKIQQRSYK